MYTVEGIYQIIVYLIIIFLIVYGVLLKINISTIKIMLLGITLIVFSNSVLKGKLPYGIDDLISIIGLSISVVGLLKRDKNSK